RGRAFAELGADLVFVESPRDEAELARVAREIPAPAMANLVEDGDTPALAPDRLEALGFKIAAYPLTLLHASVHAMQVALEDLRAGRPLERRLSFAALRELLGFDAYDAEACRYTDEE
ncbi:MAG TPA: isocitrate lyase/phosphoenolpyruvate mutase family protein, partial [Myxococcota bacterium]|nr:isocitrate lyase/phosphoenolpyruvate mutase family protein [Myxococcota bacterium]